MHIGRKYRYLWQKFYDILHKIFNNKYIFLMRSRNIVDLLDISFKIHFKQIVFQNSM